MCERANELGQQPLFAAKFLKASELKERSLSGVQNGDRSVYRLTACPKAELSPGKFQVKQQRCLGGSSLRASDLGWIFRNKLQKLEDLSQ